MNANNVPDGDIDFLFRTPDEPDIPDTRALAEHIRAFTAYARAFYTADPADDQHLDLKITHSRNVLGHACAIARAERVFTEDSGLGAALKLAGLYHDLGRFPQYARYKTFSDPQSVNHAHLSVRELKRTGLLAGEDRRVQRLALAAIVTHNRVALPRTLERDALAVSLAVRDADKLDIMRIMAEHLTADGPPDPVVVLQAEKSPRVSPAILRAVMARRLALYKDLRTTTDFTLLVCAWLYDCNYAWSRREAVASGFLARLVASLPRTPELGGFIRQFTADMAACADAPA